MEITKAEYQRRWRAENPEKVKAIAKRHYNKHKEVRLADNKKWRVENKDYVREQGKKWYEENFELRLRKTYGISLGDYENLLKKQNNACAICRLGFDLVKSYIDHDHATGDVRGILCFTCNVGLANFKDNQTYLKSAIAYLSVPTINKIK